MAARKKGGRPSNAVRQAREEEEEEGLLDEPVDEDIPEDLMGSIDADEDGADFPDEPPEGWPS